MGHSVIAFNPGAANMQTVNGTNFVPKQFAPLDSASKDVFETKILSSLGGRVEFVDSWQKYHALMGDVHCGSAVKRTPVVEWWKKQSTP